MRSDKRLLAALGLVLAQLALGAPAATAQTDPPAAAAEEPVAAPAAAQEQRGPAEPEAAEPLAQEAAQAADGWRESLRPMVEGIASGVPTVLKALLLLAVFWIAAIALGALARKFLELVKIDDRASSIGLAGLLEGKDGKRRSLAGLVGTGVRWFVLAFGLLAFFDALELGMVAGPLQGMLDKIVGAVPSFIQAAVILAVYWLIATLLKLAATKGLEAIGFDERASRYVQPREIKGETVGPSGMIGRLVFYVVLLFGIPPFLDALGQQALVAPLRGMLAKMFEYLPNLVGALILFFLGKIVATIVREIVTNLLAAAGADGFAARFGLGGDERGGRKLSEICGTVAFFFVFVPILVAAVDTLAITAISEPVKATLEQLLSAVPLIFVAAVIMGIGYFIAKTVRGLVESFLSGVGFDALPEKLGLGFLRGSSEGASPSSIGGLLVMAVILLLTAGQALATLQLTELSRLTGAVLGYLPNLLIGLIIILAALSLGSYVGRLLAGALEGSEHAGLVSTVARYAIIFLGFSMGLSQLGVGRDIVQVAVSAVLGGSALALGLAFGLGGRERAKEIIEKRSPTP